MTWIDVLTLAFPPLFILCVGDYTIAKLVGKRCASWFVIGCIAGITASFIGILVGIYVG